MRLIRALIQRIEIGQTKLAIILRLPAAPARAVSTQLWRHCRGRELTMECQTIEKSCTMASSGVKTPVRPDRVAASILVELSIPLRVSLSFCTHDARKSSWF
jgi:hypothetical protein